MVKGEVLEITIAVIANEDIDDVDALASASASIDRAMNYQRPGEDSKPGLEYLLTAKQVRRFTSGTSIRQGHTRLARTRRHTIHGHGGPPPPTPQSKPS